MALYTMEVREMMKQPLIDGVFTFDYPFYSDNIKDKEEFEKLFIDYFYFREIGFETPDRFKKKLEAKLKLIMPYYRQLALTEWDKVKSVEEMMTSKNLVETTSRLVDNDGSMTSKNNTDTSGNGTTTNITNQKVSSSSESSVTTSQTSNTKDSSLTDGVASVSLSEGYLTGRSETAQNGTSHDTNESSSDGRQQSDNYQYQYDHTRVNGEQETKQKTKESIQFTSKGDVGIQTPAYAIEQWRNVLININQLILNECEDLFMKIY